MVTYESACGRWVGAFWPWFVQVSEAAGMHWQARGAAFLAVIVIGSKTSVMMEHEEAMQRISGCS